MKKILINLGIIAVVAAVAVGATVAYFSDTETVTGNTITAGTIDISLGDPTVTLPANVNDLKPGMTQYIEFDVTNDGANDVVLRKSLTDFTPSTGTINEPECETEGGTWATGQCTGNQAVDDLAPEIVYDMEITLPNQAPVQMISEDWNVAMADIKDLWMPIGNLAPGETMHVKQSYHMKETAGNEYQGDILTFNININAEQQNAVGPDTFAVKGFVFENKEDAPNYYTIIDGMWGFAKWDAVTGTYTAKGFGLQAGDMYYLEYWDGATAAQIGSPAVVDADGVVTMSGTYAGFEANQNAKYWLRYHWNNSKTLWESNVINQN